MKQPFRYFRGEFARGKFLYNLMICPNLVIQDVLDELVYQALFQWKLEEETGAGEIAIRDDDIINIGKIAGVFSSFGQYVTNSGSIYFTEDHVVNGAQRSERGLFDMQREIFKYVRVEHDEYDSDIAAEASPDRRMTVVPSDTKPVGYVKADTPLFDTHGDILWENVLSAPPDDGSAYVPFFGEQFLVFEEEFVQETNLTISVLKLMIECLQRIRYNGPSIAAFLQVALILGEGYIYDIEITPREITSDISSGKVEKGTKTIYYEVRYKLDNSVVINNLLRRYAAWQIVCRQKFKQFRLYHVATGQKEG